jgi:hypothetical protein
MISEELKKIIDASGGKYIIVENGKPEYVVAAWKDFQETCARRNDLRSLTEEELIDKINKDISLWREGQNQENADIDEIEDLEDIEYIQ